MTRIKSFISYFSKFEIALWSVCVFLIIISFCIFDRESYLTLASSLIGVTSLIFCAKGNPFGQMLMVAFSVIYGIISFAFAYYGEMITYVGMTMPMSVIALISWLKNPYKCNRTEVKIKRITKKDITVMTALAVTVTIIFYFILDYMGTANTIPSTISVTTSFVAVYLTFLRSPYYAVAYAANDIVLIVLWVLASITDIRYVSVVVCFAAFLANDIYGFISWRAMEKRQSANM